MTAHEYGLSAAQQTLKIGYQQASKARLQQGE
jgi:hypothetical protein